MTAFLTLDRLQAHAAPDFPHAIYGVANAVARQRPVLLAHWQITAAGLTGQWRTDAEASAQPNPH